eukprot:TRINITY_DN12826_c0_g1_i1.p1 TRINITY_DN12826_c0_g1~~TRINITY_DN12826_c0_g1_i1.p1  ORF type:complete len:114 (+),score=22.09 TRINITY_DN12826_c0_g1_i1:79-420(+)
MLVERSVAPPLAAPQKPSVEEDTPSLLCGHNAWDNIRVVKGMLKLRCRVCSTQWKTKVDAMWRRSKCSRFNSAGGCELGDTCPKLHIFARKQQREEALSVSSSSTCEMSNEQE